MGGCSAVGTFLETVLVAMTTKVQWRQRSGGSGVDHWWWSLEDEHYKRGGRGMIGLG